MFDTFVYFTLISRCLQNNSDFYFRQTLDADTWGRRYTSGFVSKLEKFKRTYFKLNSHMHGSLRKTILSKTARRLLKIWLRKEIYSRQVTSQWRITDFIKGGSNCVLGVLMRKGERANFDNTSHYLTVQEFIKAHPHVLQGKLKGVPPPPIFLLRNKVSSVLMIMPQESIYWPFIDYL